MDIVVDIVDNHFNPRLREGGDSCEPNFSTIRPHFNPRLREGGDTRWMATQPTVQISIHASAKEATLDEQKPFKVVLYISIHASAKEATRVGY